jgi:hypothetical protein
MGGLDQVLTARHLCTFHSSFIDLYFEMALVYDIFSVQGRDIRVEP